MVRPERPNAEIASFDVSEDYYCCEKCLTHIALLSQLDKKKVKTHPDEPHIADIVFLLINKAQNLLHDDKDVNMLDVRAAYCAKCLADLGFRLDEKATILEGGGYLLYADRLMLWKEPKYLDAVTEEPAPVVPVARKMFDSVNEDLAKTVTSGEQLTSEERREKLIRLSEELKNFLGRYGQVEENTSESGSEEQEVEGNTSEAGTEDLVEENPPKAGTDEQLEENTPEARTEEQVEESKPEAVTGEPVEKNKTGAGNEDSVDQNKING